MSKEGNKEKGINKFIWGDGIEMVSEAVLKEKYIVWGQFFQLTIANDCAWMRPEARIERRQNTSTINSKKQRTDAVIVMLNPGSCKPIIGSQFGEWTEAMPDKTQFQLMRLMEHMSWNEIKIVNLSDVCEGNSNEFSGLLKKCKDAGVVHSRFANDSVSEWSKVISSADRLLYGWGEKPEAKKMANAYGLLDLDTMLTTYGKKPIAVWHPVKGYPKHPYPWIPERCEAWLEDMVEILSEKRVLA
ncbi:hypothetical protein [Paenisporosarcina sp. NPDC076898]|uniref:hypothetical protein n=1 Tax=unclassified Paenisporosarcina TaxID=2642018 RepID=UPI003D03F92B